MADDEKPEGRFSIRKIRDIVKPDKKEEESFEVVAVKEPEETAVVEAEVVEEPQATTPPPVSEPPEEKKGFFSQFPKTYWVADALELFERGAYYGMLAVMSVHMANNLGIDEVTIGLLFSLLLFFSYFWPLFASALAEKYGYRQVIMVSFGLLISGYFMTSTLRAGSLPLFVIALLPIYLQALHVQILEMLFLFETVDLSPEFFLMARPNLPTSSPAYRNIQSRNDPRDNWDFFR